MRPPADLFDRLIVPMPVVTESLASLPQALPDVGPLMRLWSVDPRKRGETREYHFGFTLVPKEPLVATWQLTTLLAHPKELPA